MFSPVELLLLALFLGFLLGALMHRSHFCTMGAIADLVSSGDSTRLRIWALAIATAVTGLYGGHSLLGWDVHASFYTLPRLYLLSHIVGGLLFGSGMVLASGCGSKTLVRLASGNLKSLVVFVVMAAVSLISLKGALALLRTRVFNSVFVDLDTPATLPAVLSSVTGLNGSSIAFSFAGLLAIWALSHPALRKPANALTGIGLGLIITAAWWLTLHAGFVAEDPETLQPVWLATYTGKPEALTFTAPMAHWLEWLAYASDSSRRLSMGMLAVAGVIMGAFASARLQGPIKADGFRQTQDLKRHLAGASLMGFGGVLALGCTVGQGLSGMATLSIGSVVSLLCMLVGAAWQVRRDYARL